MTTPIRFVSLLFPQVTQLDLTGSVQVFSLLPGATIDLVWHGLEPVDTDAGFSINPTATFESAPQADVLMVPGGQGAFDALDDPAILDFVARQAAGATFVTSVCTGAFVLGAVGLLAGRRATTHWAVHSLLAKLGAIPTHGRVVRDGRVVTGGGVTSGIDFALTVAAELCGEQVARTAQLTIEYDPDPPFDAGAPDRPQADPRYVAEVVRASRGKRGPTVARAAAALREGGPGCLSM
ncbi:DJ-1/PfpI family protein [Brevibacterium oceani]|uniref:DJ-1/PfpI family protein n=1 Tax=Brevibacterium oceani TaxID=358099 RepID=UPI0015E6B61C|nr:DJ-1/PfpI family protein [Brevibacterium oceani]